MADVQTEQTGKYFSFSKQSEFSSQAKPANLTFFEACCAHWVFSRKKTAVAAGSTVTISMMVFSCAGTVKGSMAIGGLTGTPAGVVIGLIVGLAVCAFVFLASLTITYYKRFKQAPEFGEGGEPLSPLARTNMF